MQPQQALQLVQLTQALKAKQRKPAELKHISFYGTLDIWHYRGVFDPKSQCNHCKENDGKTFLGSALRTEFPDHEIIDENTIYVNLHMTLWSTDTCKCYLWRDVPFNVNPESSITLEELTPPEIQIEQTFEEE